MFDFKYQIQILYIFFIFTEINYGVTVKVIQEINKLPNFYA